jgi:hypothetical protein
MNQRQKAILLGMVLGDCYLQKTGEKNSRIRLEHSYFRWQSNASPEIGRYRQIFYQNGKKVIPKGLPMLFDNSL